MIESFLPLFLFVASTFLQSQRAIEIAGQPYDVDEAYAVYSAVLPDEWTVRYGHAMRLVIGTETVFYKTCLTAEEESRVSQAPAIADYYRANQKRWILLPRFKIELSYTLAVLYVAHHCGSLCGGGTIRALQKKDGKWQPGGWEGRLPCMWVS